MAQNRVRGGRQRGESKEQVFFICPICHKEVSKRQSRQAERNGEMVRMCKRHHCPEKKYTTRLDEQKGKQCIRS